MSSESRPVRLRSAVESLLSLAGGVSLAAVPAAVLAISSRLFTTVEQGFVAVAVLLATYVGQLASAAIVESRLGSAGTSRAVVMPRWLVILASIVAVVAAVVPGQIVVVVIALPVLLAALEVGRQIAIAERLDRRELVASVVVGAGAIGGVSAGMLDQTWAYAPLVLSIGIATVVRGLPVAFTASPPDPVIRRWILADTAVTGVVMPVLNVVILGLLGPIQAVIFTAVSTASGVLAIPLNFMRARLLKAHSTLDIVASGVAVAGCLVALMIAHLSGVLGWFFGSPWTIASATLALVAACAWRAGSLATSVPFAALRRLGHARLVALLRAGVSALTVGLAIAGLLVGAAFGPTGGVVGVFAGLVVAELGAAVVYEAARRRVDPVRR